MSKLKRIREERLISKSELARKAGVSTVTIDRIERGYSCRVATKRRILEALGLSVADKDQVFDD
jgi:predicted transcriptional regulator